MTDTATTSERSVGHGYRDLKSFQGAQIICDFIYEFCHRFVDKKSRTHDQMVQAARSGKQNIVEGSVASRTSPVTELRLTGIARASLKELQADLEDFLRQRQLPVWGREDDRISQIRSLATARSRSYATYACYLEGGDPEVAANALICLIHQTTYLLHRQLDFLEARKRQSDDGERHGRRPGRR